MKKYVKYISVAILLGTLILTSCKEDHVTAPDKYRVPEAPASGTLKALAQARSLKIGNTLSYKDLSNQSKLDLLKREFDNVTFEYEMKHGSVVKDDGTMDWSNADAMMAWAKNNSLPVYGHVLVWHQNQNATYLKTIAAPPVSEYRGPNMVTNPTMDENIDDFQQMNPGTTGACGPRIELSDDGRNGTKCLYVDGTCDAITADDYWRVQIATTLSGDMLQDNTYRVEFWIKAEVAGNIQFEIRGGNAGGDGVRYIAPIAVTTDWTKISIEHTALGSETGVVTFDLNNANHTKYWIDDMDVYQFSDRPFNIVQNPTIDDNLDGYAQINPNPTGGCGPRIELSDDGRNGTKCLYVDGTCDAITADDYWRVQVRAMFNRKMTKDVDYVVKFWIKAKVAGTVQLETREASGGDPQYKTFPATADWSEVTLMFTAIGTEDAICFDLNNANHTEYWVDDVSVSEYVADTGGDGPSEEDIAKIDNEMQSWITECVNHFKGDVKAWEVVNEPLVESGALRTGANSSDGTDIFYWSDFLGRDYALKAFKYAEAADPSALLFINEYNLELHPEKLDSLIAYVTELKKKGAKIDGIGTQMHIANPKDYGPVRESFEKLAKTGLLIKITELDVKASQNGKEELAQIDAEFQAAAYEYILKTYLEVIPKEQQYGITIWGINDGDSWIKPQSSRYFFPLLWDDNLNRKISYDAVYKTLE